MDSPSIPNAESAQLPISPAGFLSKPSPIFQTSPEDISAKWRDVMQGNEPNDTFVNPFLAKSIAPIKSSPVWNRHSSPFNSPSSGYGSNNCSPMLRHGANYRGTLACSSTGLASPLAEVTNILRAAAKSTAASAKMTPPGDYSRDESVPPVPGYEEMNYAPAQPNYTHFDHSYKQESPFPSSVHYDHNYRMESPVSRRSRNPLISRNQPESPGVSASGYQENASAGPYSQEEIDLLSRYIQNEFENNYRHGVSPYGSSYFSGSNSLSQSDGFNNSQDAFYGSQGSVPGTNEDYESNDFFM